MASNTKNNRVAQLAADQKMIDGTKQLLSPLTSLIVGSQDMTPAQIEQVFQDRIDAGNAAVKAEDVRKAAVKADKDERKKTTPFVQAFKRIVIGMFLQSPDKLGLFGLQAPKTAKKTAASKAAAAANAVATKKARGPIGKKQRAKVKAPTATAGSPQPQPATPTNGAATPAPTAAQAPSPVPTATPAASPVAAAPKAGS
jgi:hypothetical protein